MGVELRSHLSRVTLEVAKGCPSTLAFPSSAEGFRIHFWLLPLGSIEKLQLKLTQPWGPPFQIISKVHQRSWPSTVGTGHSTAQ